MGKKVIKDTEWVKEQIPVKLDDDGNVVNKETGKPVGEKIFDMIGEGEPTKDMNPDKKGVLYFDKTSGIIWVCTSNEEDNNIWKSNTGNWVGSTISKLDIFGDGSCIALYKLDGDADDVGGEYDGTWSGTEDYDDDGKFGKAAKFDGSSAIDVHDYDFSDVKSISLFFKSTDTDGWNTFLGSKGDGNDNILLGIHNGKLANYDPANEYNDIDNNVWYHIVINSVGDNKVDVFLNGDKVGDNDSNNNSFDLYFIGADNKNNDVDEDESFVGLLDQVRIFNRVLTGDEVEALYKEGGN